MSLIELFLIAVGLSMDAFAVAVCKGLAMPKMSWKGAAIVGLYFGGFQALMPFLGYLLGAGFKDAISAYDHWVAFILLALIGGNMIRESREDEEESLDLLLDEGEGGEDSLFEEGAITLESDQPQEEHQDPVL